MRIAGRKILTTYCKAHADLRKQVSAWVAFVENAEWESPNDIKVRFSSASFLPNNHVIFNLKGNKYRLEVQISYNTKQVRVIRIGTHADYDKWG